jgi:hypothetical protein
MFSSYGFQKTQNFLLISIPLKKFKKNIPQKRDGNMHFFHLKALSSEMDPAEIRLIR